MGGVVGSDGLFGWSWQLLAAALACLAALALFVSLVISRGRWRPVRVLLGISLLVGALVLARFAPFPGPVPRAAPAAADARYYTVEPPFGTTLTTQGTTSPNTLLALSTRSGAVLWQYHPTGAQDVSVLGVTPTFTIVYEGTSPQPHVVALDAADGHVRWRFDVARGNYLLTRVLPEQDMLVIGATSQVVGVALSSGAMRWRYVMPAGLGVEQPLLADGNTILVRAAPEAPYSAAGVHLIALGTQNGALRWQADLGTVAPPGRTMAMAESRAICVVMGSGEPGSGVYQYGVTAFDVQTGATLWQHEFARGNFDPYTGQVFTGGNTCYVMDEGSLLALDDSTGTPRFALPGATISAPSGSTVRLNAGLADGTMLFVAAGPSHAGALGIETIYAIGATDGQIKWRFRTDSNAANLALSPQRDSLYVSASKLSVLSPADGHVRWKTSRQLPPVPLDPVDTTGAPALSAATDSPEVTFLLGRWPTCVLLCGNQQMYLWAASSSTGMQYWRIPLGLPEIPHLPIH